MQGCRSQMLLKTKYNHCTCGTRIDVSTEIDFFNAITEGITVYYLYAYKMRTATGAVL